MDINNLRQLRLQRYSGEGGTTATATSASCTTSSSNQQAHSGSSTANTMQDSHGFDTGAAPSSVPSALLTTPLGMQAAAGAGGYTLSDSNGPAIQPSAMQSHAGMFALLSEVKDLLVALPATIAGALAAAQPAVPAAVPPTTVSPTTVTPTAVPPTTAPPATQHTTSAAVATSSVAVSFSKLTASSAPTDETPSQQEVGHGDGTVSGGYNGGGGAGENNCGVCHMPITSTDQQHAYVKCGHYPFCTTCVEKVKKTGQCPLCKSDGYSIVLQFDD